MQAVVKDRHVVDMFGENGLSGSFLLVCQMSLHENIGNKPDELYHDEGARQYGFGLVSAEIDHFAGNEGNVGGCLGCFLV
jgi:hypothetical protein